MFVPVLIVYCVGRGGVHAWEEGGLGQVKFVERHTKLLCYGLLDLIFHLSEMDPAQKEKQMSQHNHQRLVSSERASASGYGNDSLTWHYLASYVHHSWWHGTGETKHLRLVNCRSLKFSCCSDTLSIGFCCTLSLISAADAYNTVSTTDWWPCFRCTLSIISAAADIWLSFSCLFWYMKGWEAGTGCDVTNCGRDMIKGGPVVVARRMSSVLGLDKSYLLLVHHNCKRDTYCT